LFGLYAKCGSKKTCKMITHFFVQICFWMKKYNIVVIIFNSDFEGEMNVFVPLCVHEKKCD
jgi:hypothetical protein